MAQLYLLFEQNCATVTGTAGAQREAQFDIENLKPNGSRLILRSR
jgi:hypothetical protein